MDWNPPDFFFLFRDRSMFRISTSSLMPESLNLSPAVSTVVSPSETQDFFYKKITTAITKVKV